MFALTFEAVFGPCVALFLGILLVGPLAIALRVGWFYSEYLLKGSLSRKEDEVAK